MLLPQRRLSSTRGFTLIEVLVTLVVMSIGLLGLAALQLTSLKANHSSATRTQAIYLANDIIDRMRANLPAAAAGNYNTTIGAKPAGGTVAGDDLVAWKQAIAGALPQGDINNNGQVTNADGTVTYVAATNLVTVSVVWDDSHARITDDLHPGAVNTRLPDVVTFTVTTQLFN